MDVCSATLSRCICYPWSEQTRRKLNERRSAKRQRNNLEPTFIQWHAFTHPTSPNVHTPRFEMTMLYWMYMHVCINIHCLLIAAPWSGSKLKGNPGLNLSPLTVAWLLRWSFSYMRGRCASRVSRRWCANSCSNRSLLLLLFAVFALDE